jgi:hypothetical protein
MFFLNFPFLTSILDIANEVVNCASEICSAAVIFSAMNGNSSFEDFQNK